MMSPHGVSYNPNLRSVSPWDANEAAINKSNDNALFTIARIFSIWLDPV